ncbi:hypothetical protein VE02_01134 [Pseudogymnoascus sp. 03VT05]|nr:hypothetical protein VE02_01134 [Pseudogymnoascus sp. 03VT05]
MSSTSIIPEALPTAQVSKKSLPTHVHLHAVACMRYYDGGSALDAAATEQNPAIVRLLLDNSAKIDTTGPSGYIALWWAIDGGYKATVQLLIYHGADVNEEYDNGGRSALKEAVVRGHAAIVMLLLRKQDGDRRSLACRKVLDFSVDHQYTEAVRELLEWGVYGIIPTGNALGLFEAARDGD